MFSLEVRRLYMKLGSLQEEDIVVFEFFFCFLTANFFVMKKIRSESGTGFVPDVHPLEPT
jgi:hypothetical protein